MKYRSKHIIPPPFPLANFFSQNHIYFLLHESNCALFKEFIYTNASVMTVGVGHVHSNGITNNI